MDPRKEREELIKAARDIAQKAQAETRSMTADEITSFDEHMAKADELAATIKAGEESQARIKAVANLGTFRDESEPEEAKSLGDLFVKSAGVGGLSNLRYKAGASIGTPEFKAATTTQTTGELPATLLTDVDRTIVHGYRPRPVVADVMGVGSLSGNAVTYYVEGAIEGAFATVAEGGQKPQLHNVAPTAVTDALKKIAGWWDMSDEMVEDAAFMVSEINNRGLYLLSMAEEAQLLNGDGTGANLRGLLNRSGIQTETQAASADTAADAIFRASTKVQTATGLTADALLINPADYQGIRLAKDGNGQYYGGGFFYGPYGNGGVTEQPPLWGLRTIVTAAVPAKTVVVGAFQAATTVYRKGGVRVESTNSDQGKFTTNVITTRIEERIALAVRVPAAIVKVTVL